MISERGRGHSHIFIGKEQNSFELRTWLVMIICFSSMIIEITCGIIFGSLALVADGIHMGTHCIAFFLTAFAYSYSRVHQENPFFVFGTGKIAELSSFTSGFILVIVACVIIYESITRFIKPEKIIFLDALPVAFVGLTVNVASGIILMCKCSNQVNHGDNNIEMSHDHGHSHGHATNQYEYEDLGDEENPITVDHHNHDHDHGHGHDHEEHEEPEEHEHHHDETFEIMTSQGTLILSIYEEDVPPEFRISFSNWKESIPQNINVTTIRDDGSKQVFEFSTLSGSNSSIVLHSTVSIPEPHQFKAKVSYIDPNGSNQVYSVDFIEHEHGHDHNHSHGNDHQQENQSDAKFYRDNNYRAAICHVVADAFVSILVIISLVIIGTTGKAQFLDPLVALIGAFVILSWSWTLIIDTSLNLLDTMPDKKLVNLLKKKIEMDGSIIDDLHVWRLGPGHLGAILSLRTHDFSRNKAYYLNKLKGFKSLSHITIEIEHEGNIVQHDFYFIIPKLLHLLKQYKNNISLLG